MPKITKAALWACALALGGVLAAAGQDKGGFGALSPRLLDLKGSVYYLPAGTVGMPPGLEKQKPRGFVYADKLDVPDRESAESFPGVGNRSEWFGLLYKGTFQVSAPGLYKWRLASDDGSRLWIDGRQIIDNDGVHGFQSREGSGDLAQGPHAIKVWFFQGPAAGLGLQLFVTPPGSKERIFFIQDFSGGLTDALTRLKAEATAEGIRVRMDAQVLFDSGSSTLKPEAIVTLDDVARIIGGYPGCTVRIEGHTDSQGEDAKNLKLSEERAACVEEALAALPECKGVAFRTMGRGKSRPVAANDTEAGRAQNRRVEITIVPASR